MRVFQAVYVSGHQCDIPMLSPHCLYVPCFTSLDLVCLSVFVLCDCRHFMVPTGSLRTTRTRVMRSSVAASRRTPPRTASAPQAMGSITRDSGFFPGRLCVTRGSFRRYAHVHVHAGIISSSSTFCFGGVSTEYFLFWRGAPGANRYIIPGGVRVTTGPWHRRLQGH